MQLVTASKLKLNTSMKSIDYSLSESELSEQVQEPMSLSQVLDQYMNQPEQEEQSSQNVGDQIVDIKLDNVLKNNIKPLRMFKDQMELTKQNNQKKRIVKELQLLNEQLKMEYEMSLRNNKKMETFLKEIQFTFKNDRSNQKANETLLKATKTLHREQQESKNYIEKLVKTAKTNEMRELKAYFKVLENQKERLLELLSKETAENQNLRKNQDFNESERQCFDECQEILVEILQDSLNTTAKKREQYLKQKCEIKIKMNLQEAQHIKKQIHVIDQKIAAQLLKKQGLEYEKQVIINKMKEKNKRSYIEQGTMLREQIKTKKKNILALRQQLKQKSKTQQYIQKWTKQLKFQLEQLKQKHIQIKQNYQEEINMLSQQIQEYNRRYKAELIEQQALNKKLSKMDAQNDNIFAQRKIRIVKLYEIDYLRKKLIYHLLQNNINRQQFLHEFILGKGKTITLKQLHERLCQLEVFQDQNTDDLFKLARYVVEDNNNDYAKINVNEGIQTHIAKLIFKNLLAFDINSSNINAVKMELKQILRKNFDSIRHDIWQSSGKSSTFNSTNLKNSFEKYAQEESKLSKFVQFIEFSIWKKFGQIETIKITSFQKFCELLLGIKLVKDSQNRMSKTTIRSVFDKVYRNHLV